jgi:hypothetical protein
MGGLDCEVDVVESVDTAVEAEGAVSAAWRDTHRLQRRRSVMTRASDSTGILLYTILSTLFVLSCIYVPA